MTLHAFRMHNACGVERQEKMLPNFQIRDLPDDIYLALQRQAEREQRSLSQQAIVELRRALQLDGGARRRALIEQLMLEPNVLSPDSPSTADLIRADRDR